ncbi:hypothetical protein AJ79_01949 [Helicocarpus griseus UAMH5409]|uniref:Glutaredoxin domain-containing protein n=1 Tax=Helicocarpus griseus UAMH5409 TaxID=1447875 RepID=A0A2B7Y5N8_9EURO|nr:hypothetical protein AJ79_01949 [Helicocarpus griseus UAMH5409]
MTEFTDPKSYRDDPTTLYLYTSLTAGSSHIITATSRLETILKANKIPFQAIDIATDEPARKLWGRRSRGKKLPGLVRDGMIVGDLTEIEEWNEYGEIKMHLGNGNARPAAPAVSTTATTAASKPATAPSTTTATPPVRDSPRIQIQDPPSRDTATPKEDSITLALRQAGEEAASKAKDNTRAKLSAKTASTNAPKPEETSSSSTADPESTTTTTEDMPALDSQKAPPERLREIRQSLSVHRPSLSGVAAESTADLKVDSAEAKRMSRHHHGSVVSVTSPREQDQLAKDLEPLDSEPVFEEEDVGGKTPVAEVGLDKAELKKDEKEEEGGKGECGDAEKGSEATAADDKGKMKESEAGEGKREDVQETKEKKETEEAAGTTKE